VHVARYICHSRAGCRNLDGVGSTILLSITWNGEGIAGVGISERLTDTSGKLRIGDSRHVVKC
jgi:hypothetical protein